MSENSRGKSLTASEKTALKILHGLWGMGLVPTQIYSHVEIGEIKTAPIEQLTNGVVQEIKERKIKFSWLDNVRVVITLSKWRFYNPDQKPTPESEGVADYWLDDKIGEWWDAKMVEIKIRGQYDEEGEIKFTDKAAINTILQAYHKHVSFVYHND